VRGRRLCTRAAGAGHDYTRTCALEPELAWSLSTLSLQAATRLCLSCSTCACKVVICAARDRQRGGEAGCTPGNGTALSHKPAARDVHGLWCGRFGKCVASYSVQLDVHQLGCGPSLVGPDSSLAGT
jgi:hypothetical protein